jgi:hypothetical protein
MRKNVIDEAQLGTSTAGWPHPPVIHAQVATSPQPIRMMSPEGERLAEITAPGHAATADPYVHGK